MKKVLTLTLLLALPVAADEAAKKTEPQKPAAQGTVLTPPAAVDAGDSPLVAASKRANRKGKKATNVITNETLKQPKNAHITTTTNPGPAPLPADTATNPGREAQLQNAKVTAAEKKAAEDEAKKKKETAKARLSAAAAAAESDYVDPAYAEAQLAEAAKEAEKAGEKKPPQQ